MFTTWIPPDCETSGVVETPLAPEHRRRKYFFLSPGSLMMQAVGELMRFERSILSRNLICLHLSMCSQRPLRTGQG